MLLIKRSKIICDNRFSKENNFDFFAKTKLALQRIYSEINSHNVSEKLGCISCGKCCDFSLADHELYLSLAEAIYMVKKFGLSNFVNVYNSAADKGCPYFINHKCSNREGRAIGCRVFYCNETGNHMQDFSNDSIYKLKQSCDDNSIPWFYGPLEEVLVKANLVIGKDISCSFTKENTGYEINKILI